MTINNQVNVYKVSNSENNSDKYNNDSELMLSNYKKEVFECDTVSNSRIDESIKSVEVSNGVVISTDELEKEWRDSLNVEYEQRANFSRNVGEARLH